MEGSTVSAGILHKPFIGRQISHSKKQSAVFVLCVALSIVTLVSLNGFSRSVNDSLLKDARKLNAADLIIHSHYELSPPLLEAVASLQKDGLVQSARVYEFYSVVRNVPQDASLLASLKVVGPGYPFYGKVELASGRSFDEVLQPGTIIVEEALLYRLGLHVGDQLHVGESLLTIRDVVVHEPDRPMKLFALGPRIFIALADRDALNLVKKGSRVDHNLLLRVSDENDLDRLALHLGTIADRDQERVQTFKNNESRVKKFLDNFFFFLHLIGIFTLVLAGIGIQSVLSSLLKEKEATIAIIKTVGATGRFITLQFVAVLTILGSVGTLAGLCFGFLVQCLLPALFRGLLPNDVGIVFSWRTILEGLGLGVFVVALFAVLPLFRLRELKPSSILRKETGGTRRGPPFYAVLLTILGFFVLMVFWQVQDLRVGMWLVVGILGLVLVTALLTHAVLAALRRARVKSLPLRQALKGLFRPGNATQLIIITLSASLAVVFSIYLIEQNLDASFVTSYPPDVPNLFFLDIQPSQLAAFKAELGEETAYYPVVRARVLAVNGKTINVEEERTRRGDNLAREFSLTYRDRLLDDEAVVAGKDLFRKDWDGLQVSVLDTVVKMQKMEVGDRITFRIQGVPLEARISSIRTHLGESIRPYFYFVFPEETMKEAPQTIFTAVRVKQGEMGPLQSRIVSRFPNVSVIDMTETIATFSGVMHKLSKVTRFFALFSLAAGILIIVSSIFAMRFARIREAVYFKILGAKSRFVLRVFTLESIILGLVSALLAMTVSQGASWFVVVRTLDISYRAFPASTLGMIGGAILLVVLVGLSSSLSILKQKPAAFLREQTEE
jgi:putative ABC transport system permease protein